MEANRCIAEAECYRDGQQISYSFMDMDVLYQTAVQMMRRSDVKCLVPCSISQLNGKLKMTYSISRYRSAKNLILAEPKNIFKIVYSLIDVMKQIDDIGFLAALNFCWNVEDVMIEESSMQAYLLYLPLHPAGIAVTPEILEACCKQLLRQCVQANAQLFGSNVGKAFLQILQGSHSLQEVEQNVRLLSQQVEKREADDAAARQIASQAAQSALREEETTRAKAKHGIWPFGRKKGAEWRLIGQGDAGTYVIAVGTGELVIGKSREKANVVLDSGRVSREHCHVRINGDTFEIMDCGSTNGTFLGSRSNRIPKDEWVPVQTGTMIWLADMAFHLECR